MLKYLRIAISALCSILCLLMMLLWIRSYSVTDAIQWDRRPENIMVISTLGAVQLTWFENQFSNGDGSWRIQSTELSPEFGSGRIFEWFFYHERDVMGAATTRIGWPWWFNVLLAITMGVLPWVPWKGRFSLRTLLIATTLIAAGLGLIVLL
jgi:hypothetical protein